MKDFKNKIKKYLRSKKEEVVIDLYIENYNKRNYYIGLIYNNKINKYKVLYIPIDIIDNNIKLYTNYQFININLVNYIYEVLNNNKNLFIDSKFIDKVNYNINTYYIEINININKDNYILKCTKFIPKEWNILYEVILLLFEHSPNILGGLCSDILGVLDNREDNILYQESIDIDIYKDNINNIFINNKLLEILFLEKINNKYYSIIDDKLIILEYFNGTCNLFCSSDNNNINDYFYSVIYNIRNSNYKEFYKIKEDNIYYICTGIKNGCFNVVEEDHFKLIPISKYRDKCIDIIGSNRNQLIKDI